MTSSSVFISGSIAIKTLPQEVKSSIDNIIAQNFRILVGDAKGVDLLVQQYCQSKSYFNVCVYFIINPQENPREIASQHFTQKMITPPENIKKTRERQMRKDSVMTDDCHFSLIIWDGKSKGSYANIQRTLEQNKKIKLYTTFENGFSPPSKITASNVEFIFRQHNGYSASEIVKELQANGYGYFSNTLQLNKFLLNKGVVTKPDKTYLPTTQFAHLLIEKKYKGKPAGVAFTIDFIDWIEEKLKKTFSPTQCCEDLGEYSQAELSLDS